MGSKTETTSNYQQQQTAAPPSWTMPGIQQTADKVTAALGTLPGEKYTGDFTAQLDPNLVKQAMDAYQSASGQAGSLAGSLTGMLPALSQAPTVGTYNMGPGADKSGVISAAIDPVFRELTQKILPGIKSSSLASGAYSGDRASALMPGQAIQQSNEAAQRLAAQITYQDYQDSEARRLAAYQTDQGNNLNAYGLETNRMGLAPGMADTIMRMSAGSGDLISQALALKTQQDQAGIDNNVAKDTYNLQYPFRGLDIASGLLSQLSGSYGTTSGSGSSSTVQQTGGLGAVMQGLMGAASLGASLMAPGLGSAASAIGGGVGKAASSIGSFVPNAASVFGAH